MFLRKNINQRKIILPLSKFSIKNKIKYLELESGAELLLVSQESIPVICSNFYFPFGAFQEAELNLSGGISSFVASSLNEHMERSLWDFNIKENSTSLVQTTYNNFMEFEDQIVLTWNRINNFEKNDLKQSSLQIGNNKLIGKKMKNDDLLLKRLFMEEKNIYRNDFFSGLKPSTLNFLQREAFLYYKLNYLKRYFKFGIIGNFESNENELDNQKFIKEIRDRISAILEEKEYKRKSKRVEKSYEMPLPFTELPQAVFVQSDNEYSWLKIVFQLKTSYKIESEFAPLKYISSRIENLLGYVLLEKKFIHDLKIDTKSLDSFSMLKIKIKLTKTGEEHNYKIIACLFSILKKIKREIGFRNYAILANQLKTQFDFSLFGKSQSFLQLLMEGLDKFGARNCLRASRTLNNYNKKSIVKIIDQLTEKNMVLVFKGNFEESSSIVENQNFNFIKTISSRIGSFYTPSKTAILKSNTILNRRDSDLGLSYRKYKITESDWKEIEFETERAYFDFSKIFKNSYEYSSKFLNKNKRTKNSNFKNREIQVLSELHSIFYKHNEAYEVPQSFLTLRLTLQDKEKTLTLSKQQYHILSLIQVYIMNSRLNKINQYLKKFNGKVEVHFSENTILINIFSISFKVSRVVNDVLERINFEINPVNSIETNEAYNLLMRHLLSQNNFKKSFHQDFKDLLLKNHFLNKNLSEVLKKEYKSLMKLEIFNILVFGYYEGSLNKTEVKKIFVEIKKTFQTKESGNQKLEKLKNLQSDELPIFQKIKIDTKNSNGALYLSGLVIGDITSEILKLSWIIKEKTIQLMKEVSEKIILEYYNAELELVADKILLKIEVHSSNLINAEKFNEQVLENLFKDLRTIKRNDLQILEKKSILRNILEGDILKELATYHEKLFFLSKKFIDIQEIKHKPQLMTLDLFQFYNSMFKVFQNPRRIVLETISRKEESGISYPKEVKLFQKNSTKKVIIN